MCSVRSRVLALGAVRVAQGHVTQPADLDRVIDTQYLQEALRRLGTAP